MVSHVDDNDGKARLAVSYNANNQADHFREIFQFYGLKFEDCCVCLIEDNASVNVKTAELCCKPHIGCKSHKLNLEFKAMCTADETLQSTLEELCSTANLHLSAANAMFAHPLEWKLSCSYQVLGTANASSRHGDGR
jgi:hypothetical protein